MLGKYLIQYSRFDPTVLYTCGMRGFPMGDIGLGHGGLSYRDRGK